MARDVDRGMNTLIKELNYLDNHTLRIGVLAGGVDSDSAGKVAGERKAEDTVEVPGKGGGTRKVTTVTQIEVFAAHELGKGVPRRESLGWVMDNEREALGDVARRTSTLVLDGKMTGERALGFMGEKTIALIQKRIRDGISPELDERTIERKTRAGGKTAAIPLISFSQ